MTSVTNMPRRHPDDDAFEILTLDEIYWSRKERNKIPSESPTEESKSTASPYCPACHNLAEDELRRLAGLDEDLTSVNYRKPIGNVIYGDGGSCFFNPVMDFCEQSMRGCSICYLITEALGCFYSVDEIASADCIRLVSWDRHGLLVSLMDDSFRPVGDPVELFSPKGESKVRTFSEISYLPCLSVSESNIPAALGFEPIIPAFWSDQTRESILNWIDNCSSKHKRCAQRFESGLPHRVLDLGPSNSTLDPRLYEVTTVHKAKFIALSHRWGNRVILKTEKANLSDHKSGIPWSKLSTTFQEAIKITRWLGIRYIWIDSLCIVQDDPVDWERESENMAFIYEQAHVVLAARTRPDRDSCLPETFKVYQKPLKQGNQLIPVNVRLGILHEFLHKNSSSPNSDELLDRGWCFQERLLATRVLHLTQREVVFECRQCIECQCKYDSNHTRFEENPIFRDPENYVWRNHDAWFEVVSEYSRKHLTYSKDMLPALSGVAQRFGNMHRENQYIAGLWGNDLKYNLIWERADVELASQSTSRGIARRPQEYLAPTFSWASTIGPKKTPLRAAACTTTPCNVLKVSCTASGATTYGQVSGGFIQVSGRIVSFKCSPVDDNDRNIGIGCLHLYPELEKSFLYDSIDDVDTTENELHCLEVLGESMVGACTDIGWPNGPHGSIALVLRKDTANENTYRRVGIITQVPSHLFEVSETDIIII